MDYKNKKRAILAVIGEISANAKTYRNSFITRVVRYGMEFRIDRRLNGEIIPPFSVMRDGKCYGVWDDMKQVIDLCGNDIPDYERSADFQALIDGIKAKAGQVSKWVDFGSFNGLLGGLLRGKGCFVAYDGFSVCEFEYGGLYFCAMKKDGRWGLTKQITAIREDGTNTESFDITSIDEMAEAFLWGMTRTGKRITEKDRIKDYKKFFVYAESNKRSELVGSFDNFEDADKYALETAKMRAEGVTGDLSRYSFRKPIDVSDKMDACSAYMWYRYDTAEYFIRVCGE